MIQSSVGNIIFTNASSAKCDGMHHDDSLTNNTSLELTSELGHPVVYIAINSIRPTKCPYCDKLYQLSASVSKH